MSRPELAGINIDRVYMLTFALGAALAGVAGQFVTFTYALAPSIGMFWTLKAMIVIVLAGTGSILGALPAGILLGVVEALERSLSRPDLQGSGRPGHLPARADPTPAGSVREEMMETAEHRTIVISPARRGDGSAPAGIVVLLVFALLFPQQMAKDNIWNLFFLICLGISIGQSWNMLGGFAGQTSLGHAAFFGIGALVTRLLWFGGIPFVLAFIVGGVAAVAFAMVIGAPTFRLRGAYFAIGTLAVAEVLRITVGQNQPFISTMSGTMIAVLQPAHRATTWRWHWP